MSRNRPAVLPEPPDAFLAHYDIDEMISYADRERANRATYPRAIPLTDCASALGRSKGRELFAGFR